jgi:hypothetical protein
MYDHSMLAAPARGRNFIRLGFLLGAAERDKVRQMLSEKGFVWLAAGAILITTLIVHF